MSISRVMIQDCCSLNSVNMNLPIGQWVSVFWRILREAEELGLFEPDIAEIWVRVRITKYLAESQRIEVTEQVTRPIHCFGNSAMSVREMMSGVGLNHLRRSCAIILNLPWREGLLR
ncbi:hypothetical protein ACKUB1_09030 [Methanospirillum stamsii]|nr:hypothetical protein [Methanospirillum stamsii]